MYNHNCMLTASLTTNNVNSTSVNFGTPMGELLRRYWQPICLSKELNDLPKYLKIMGEELVAYIEKDLKSNINQSEILNYLSQYLQPLKIPKDIRFIDKMPLGPSGKILKKSLRLELDNGK